MQKQDIEVARKIVGENIRKVRELQGYTLNGIAVESRLGIPQVRAIEEGTSAYTFDSLLKIMHALKVSFKMIAEGENIKLKSLK